MRLLLDLPDDEIHPEHLGFERGKMRVSRTISPGDPLPNSHFVALPIRARTKFRALLGTFESHGKRRFLTRGDEA